MDLQITFGSVVVSLDDVLAGRIDELSLEPHEIDVVISIRKWFDPNPDITLDTSGTTSSPRRIVISKEHARMSAMRTLDFFSLKKGDNALVCLDCHLVGGLMMVVRSLVGGLQMTIVKPSSHPLDHLKFSKPPNFAALVPQQLKNSLPLLGTLDNDEQIKGIIVGGAPIDPSLMADVKSLKLPIYHTFGMTETISHIALRRISGKNYSDHYKILPGVSIKSDSQGKLNVNPGFDNAWIQTNDIVRMIDKEHFEWLGRSDNVINSGGIKIYPESIEPKIGEILRQSGFSGRFFVAGRHNEKYHQTAVLVLEGDNELDHHSIQKEIKNNLPRYHTPGEIISVDQFFETSNGKVKRKETLDSYLNK